MGLDEHEGVALDDQDDLGALADEGCHELQGVAGQGPPGPPLGTAIGMVWVYS
jgi:hypothetical protein